MSKAKQIAQQFYNDADYNWLTIRIDDHDVITLSKTFPIGNTEEFREIDILAESLMLQLPTTSPGSTWGTQGSTVGAGAALNNGVYVLKKSGVSKRVLNALRRLMTC
jgi:hypothetical protein